MSNMTRRLGRIWPGGDVGAEFNQRALSLSLRHGEILSMLRFTTREVSGVLVLAFEASDDLVTDWQATQRDWLYKLVETHPGARFAIDLSGVSYLASSEIGFLVSLKRRIDRRAGRVVVFGVGPYILEIFRAMNLGRVLDVVDNLPSAMAKLAVPAQA
jgi:anti-sigma B factor antagonist